MGLFRTEKQKLQRALNKAIENQKPDAMRAAITAGADVNQGNEDGTWTPLYNAVGSNYEEGVRILLESGAKPNACGNSQRTAAMQASRDGNAGVLAVLLEAGVDLTAKDSSGYTALHHAAEYGRITTLRLLLEKGADPRATDNRLNTAADLAEKSYPRLADFIRGKADLSQKKEPELPATGWHLTAKDEVSAISEKPAIGYRVTEIFNFGAGTYTRIVQNVKTGAESQSLRFLDEFNNRSAVDTAREMLVNLGGEAVENTGKLAKPVARPQGGTP
ncbi:MAG: ankyrin repeat domain-containing protein [Alphaproteobacteria bacterium]